MGKSADIGGPELTVVIPTRDRRAILRETLTRLADHASEICEVIVIDDGSTDGTPAAVRQHAAADSLDLRLLEQAGRGPAAARNRAIGSARAPVCVFMNDDTWPQAGLLQRHRDFHRRNPELEAALLGRVVLPPEPTPTPFMRWVADVHFDYHAIEDLDNAGGKHFYTSNVSAKTALLRSVGGFDEGFAEAAHEDIDLGLRLEERGLRLVYDPEAVVEHWHPLDLASAIRRFRGIGRAFAVFTARHPTWPVARRPGARHRVKAGTLAGLASLGVRTSRLQQETWRFLCHEAAREGYWNAVDGVDTAENTRHLDIGDRLARLAIKDEDAQLPEPRTAT